MNKHCKCQDLEREVRDFGIIMELAVKLLKATGEPVVIEDPKSGGRIRKLGINPEQLCIVDDRENNTMTFKWSADVWFRRPFPGSRRS